MSDHRTQIIEGTKSVVRWRVSRWFARRQVGLAQCKPLDVERRRNLLPGRASGQSFSKKIELLTVVQSVTPEMALIAAGDLAAEQEERVVVVRHAGETNLWRNADEGVLPCVEFGTPSDRVSMPCIQAADQLYRS